MKKTIISAAAAVALAAFSITPANAAPFNDEDVLLNDFVWDLNLGSDSQVDDGEFVVPAADPSSPDWTFGTDTYDETYGDTLDTVTWEVWNDSDYDSFTPTCDNADLVTDAPTGDIIVTCTPTNAWDLGDDGVDILDYETEYRFFDLGDGKAVARVSLILTNNDDHTIDFGWQLSQGFGECNEGLWATGSGNTTFELNDGWIDCASDGTWTEDDVVYGGEAPVTYAYGHPDANDFPESIESWNGSSVDFANPDNTYLWSDEDADSTYSTIAAGETQIFTYFVASIAGPQPAAAYTSEIEQKLADYSDCAFTNGLGSELLAGLDATPENWIDGGENCSFDPAPQELGETGADSTGVLALGASALVAGAVAVIARRRRNA